MGAQGAKCRGSAHSDRATAHCWAGPRAGGTAPIIPWRAVRLARLARRNSLGRRGGNMQCNLNVFDPCSTYSWLYILVLPGGHSAMRQRAATAWRHRPCPMTTAPTRPGLARAGQGCSKLCIDFSPEGLGSLALVHGGPQCLALPNGQWAAGSYFPPTVQPPERPHSKRMQCSSVLSETRDFHEDLTGLVRVAYGEHSIIRASFHLPALTKLPCIKPSK